MSAGDEASETLRSARLLIAGASMLLSSVGCSEKPPASPLERARSSEAVTSGADGKREPGSAEGNTAAASNSSAQSSTAREATAPNPAVPNLAVPNLAVPARTVQNTAVHDPGVRSGIAWYENSAEAAFAAARSAGKRVVLDLWAPWCHTCLSMQNFVITAENLPGAAERFVWLAVDTEREQNAALLERLPVSVWPTFYVVDPGAGEDPAIRGRWLGAASAQQFARFLEASERSAELARRGPAGDTPEGALAEGDALAARGQPSAAARAYATALRRAAPGWPRRPETLVAQITALYKAKEYGACLELGRDHLGDTGQSASAVDFAAYALECASEAPSGARPTAELRRGLASRLEPLCQRGSAELSPDDRADACDKLSAARAALDDASGSRRATLERLAILERAAADKPPEIALTYDWARTDALIALGRAGDALELASVRERELPDNYNPPHYRAKALKALGRWEEGLAALERALSLAYGPRRIGLLTLKVDLLLIPGRSSDALAALDEQLAAYRGLPPGQRQPAAEGRVERRRRELSASLAPSR